MTPLSHRPYALLLSACLLGAPTGAVAQAERIATGGAVGAYQAFPDAIRLQNGDLVAVFYAGDAHVTRPSAAYPNAGRICLTRSRDEGRTWSEAVVVYDDPEDNRDPHVSQLADGTLVVSFFNLRLDPKRGEARLVRSRDGGRTWDRTSQVVATDWFCSAPVRQLADGTLLLPVYTIHAVTSYRAGFARSTDGGRTWLPVVRVGQESDFMVNETDVVTLRDGSLLAALRGHAKENILMQTTRSRDGGLTWSAFEPGGFLADAPSFTRLSSGEILLSYRGYAPDRVWTSAYTAFRVSRDEGRTWEGPYRVARQHGAYPATVELRDGTVLMVYYEEGPASTIRAARFRKPAPAPAPFAEPVDIELLPLR